MRVMTVTQIPLRGLYQLIGACADPADHVLDAYDIGCRYFATKEVYLGERLCALN